MRIRKALIVYKKSSYEAHVFGEKDPVYLQLLRVGSAATRTSRGVHQEHRSTLEAVQEELRALSVSFDLRQRYYLKPIRGYDLVITIGGDGTFLETAHFLEEGVMMGVNSAPSESVGFFCRANRSNFRRKIISILKDQHPLLVLSRLKLSIPGQKKIPLVLNDILFANQNPASTARYLLSARRIREEQKSSGVWISPAAGSTAAIRSAGGRSLPIRSARFQYRVREPYQPRGKRYRLRGGILSPREKVTIFSMIDDAAVYIDGPHLVYPVKRGWTITIKRSHSPLKMVG